MNPITVSISKGDAYLATRAVKPNATTGTIIRFGYTLLLYCGRLNRNNKRLVTDALAQLGWAIEQNDYPDNMDLIEEGYREWLDWVRWKARGLMGQ